MNKSYTCVYCLARFSSSNTLGGHATKCKRNVTQQQVDEHIEQHSTLFDVRTIKKYLIRKYGEVCMICGWDKKHPVTGECPVELEHVDGDANNNQLSNLKLLCPNCHSLTLTFRNRNKGHGRKERREIYRRGKLPM